MNGHGVAYGRVGKVINTTNFTHDINWILCKKGVILYGYPHFLDYNAENPACGWTVIFYPFKR